MPGPECVSEDGPNGRRFGEPFTTVTPLFQQCVQGPLPALSNARPDRSHYESIRAAGLKGCETARRIARPPYLTVRCSYSVNQIQ